MNVEQLIEDGKEKHGFYEVNSSRAFEAGVRHAIAAMFPVVAWEELEADKTYWVKPKHSSLNDPWFYERAFASNGKVKLLHFTEEFIDEIRRCPTPPELGVE